MMKVKYEYEEYWGTQVVSEMTIYKNNKVYTYWAYGYFKMFQGLQLEKIKWYHKVFFKDKIKMLSGNYCYSLGLSKKLEKIHYYINQESE